MVPTTDSRVCKILIDTYWTSKGWCKYCEPVVSTEDFAYAKSKGVIFDPVYINHDEIVRRALLAVHEVKKRNVVDAFLTSLSTS